MLGDLDCACRVGNNDGEVDGELENLESALGDDSGRVKLGKRLGTTNSLGPSLLETMSTFEGKDEGLWLC